MSKPVVEVSVALVYRDARWLVARRHADAHLGGMWEFPGGKRERGEPATAAALRELQEECGVHAIAERTLEPILYEYPDRRVSIAPVVCRWQAGEARPLGNETCRWVALAELRQLEMPPVNADIIRRLEQTL
ncbi:MAG: (deoxy)nucleoside triphosphate pyrophosphohydrolase [Phycisphaerae bacterium]